MNLLTPSIIRDGNCVILLSLLLQHVQDWHFIQAIPAYSFTVPEPVLDTTAVISWTPTLLPAQSQELTVYPAQKSEGFSIKDSSLEE